MKTKWSCTKNNFGNRVLEHTNEVSEKDMGRWSSAVYGGVPFTFATILFRSRVHSFFL